VCSARPNEVRGKRYLHSKCDINRDQTIAGFACLPIDLASTVRLAQRSNTTRYRSAHETGRSMTLGRVSIANIHISYDAWINPRKEYVYL
jgi:hypothetical protein